MIVYLILECTVHLSCSIYMHDDDRWMVEWVWTRTGVYVQEKCFQDFSDTYSEGLLLDEDACKRWVGSVDYLFNTIQTTGLLCGS